MQTTSKIKISPDFTVDDIHKIRKATSEFLKDKSPDEIIEYYKKASEKAHAQMETLRAARIAEAEQKKHTA